MKKHIFELNNFKKVSENASHAILKHPDGHEIKVSKAALAPHLKKQLLKLPMHMADGGEVDPMKSSSEDEAVMPANEMQTADRSLASAPIEAAPMPEKNFLQKADDYMQSIGAYGSPSLKPNAEKKAPMAQAPMAQAPAAPQNYQLGAPQNRQPNAAQAIAASPDYLNQMKQGYGMEGQGIQGQAQALSAQGQAAVKSAEQHAADMQSLMVDHEKHSLQLQNEIQNTIHDINNNHIDPNHYMNSKSGAGKVATAIGLILGGIGGALTHQENPAMKFIQSQIDRDVDAQKSDLGKKENMLSAYFKQTNDLHAATAMTKAFYAEKYANDLQKAAATAQSPLAKAAALKEAGNLKIQAAQALQPVAIKQTVMSGIQKGQIQPEQAVRYLVPEPHQEAVFKEIERAQDTKRMADTILKSFEQATKENTVMRTGAGLVRTPGSVYALHQSMQPTFKDLEGTVRQAAMDNTFKNITPQPGDSDHTVETKRAALMDYLKSKASAPRAKGFGIDLSQFHSTSTAGTNVKPNPNAGYGAK